MKSKIVALTLAGMLSLGVVGCGQQQQQQQPEPAKTEVQNKTEEKVQQTESTIKWTDVANAEEAAKGAGFEKFGVPGDITVNGTKFENPKFAHSGGVAQATYENGATALIIRKANGKHETALSGDRDLTKLANKWTKNYEGLDVTLYGVANGAATAMTWTEGTADYYVELKGLGGEEVSIGSEDCAAVVKAVKEANANQEQKTEQKTEQTTNNNSNNNANNNNNNNGNTNNGSDNSGSNDDGMAVTISREGAEGIACDYAGAGGQAKGPALNLTSSELIEGGGTKYYTVDFDLGDVHYNVQVDAIQGNVISASETFNGQQQLLDENAEPVDGTQQPADE